MDLSMILAQRLNPPAIVRPDKPPKGFRPGNAQGPTHPTRFETRKVNGKWVLVPVAFKPGKGDPRLTPKVSYTPFPK